MNSEEMELSWSYRMEGHFTVGGVDAGFYHALPNSQETFLSPSGRPEIPRPGIEQVLTVIGSAILSSSVLASAIKAYLASRRTKIRISVEPDKLEVEYEGPNLKESEETIKNSIDHLILRNRQRTRTVSVVAVRIPEE